MDIKKALPHFCIGEYVRGCAAITVCDCAICFEKLSDAVELKTFTASTIGEDILLSGYVKEDFHWT